MDLEGWSSLLCIVFGEYCVVIFFFDNHLSLDALQSIMNEFSSYICFMDDVMLVLELPIDNYKIMLLHKVLRHFQNDF